MKKKVVALSAAVMITSGVSVAAHAEASTYTVKSGDTLSQIALDYKTSVKKLQKDNKLESALIFPGQELKVSDLKAEKKKPAKKEVKEEVVEETVAASAPVVNDGLNWSGLAACESGGDPSAVDASGTYHGLYQFDAGTWASVGGSGVASQASAEEQTMRAQMLYDQRGASPWPVCGANL